MERVNILFDRKPKCFNGSVRYLLHMVLKIHESGEHYIFHTNDMHALFLKQAEDVSYIAPSEGIHGI